MEGSYIHPILSAVLRDLPIKSVSLEPNVFLTTSDTAARHVMWSSNCSLTPDMSVQTIVANVKTLAGLVASTMLPPQHLVYIPNTAQVAEPGNYMLFYWRASNATLYAGQVTVAARN